MKFIYFLKINDFPVAKYNDLRKSVKIPVFGASTKFREVKTNLFYDGLKTGDLLFISYVKNFLKYNFIRFFTNSVWTHVCIFYKDPVTQEPYILEAAAYSEPYGYQFIKIPFSVWLRINRNQRLAVLPLNKEISAKRLLEVKKCLKWKNEKEFYVEGLNWKWMRFCFNRKSKSKFFSGKSAKGVTCTEFVIKIYKKMGIMKPKYHYSSYLPACVYKRKIKMKNGYYFEEPYLLTGHENNYMIPL